MDHTHGNRSVLPTEVLACYANTRQHRLARPIVFSPYKYASTRETGGAEFSLLWPLVDYKSRQGVVISASVLWWLASYEHPHTDHPDFHFVETSKIALIRRMTSPRESVFKINPIIPPYRYRHKQEGGTSWDLFGGLVGMDKAKEQTRKKLFWLSL